MEHLRITEFVSPALVSEYIAPAHVAPSLDLVNPQFSTARVEASAPKVIRSPFFAPVGQTHQAQIVAGETTQNSVGFQPVLELVKVQEIPELQVVERIEEQTEEQVVVPAPPIVDDTAEKQIVEGGMGIPQEPFPEEIEEQFDPMLVPQNTCDVAPTPVMYVAPPPAATHDATASPSAAMPVVEHVMPATTPVPADTTVALKYVTPAPAIESNCASPVPRHIVSDVGHDVAGLVNQDFSVSVTPVTPVGQIVDDPIPPLLHMIKTKKEEIERCEKRLAALLARVPSPKRD